MRGGGVADKLGNRYEAQWLVRQLLGVIAGEAQALRFEGIPEEFNGFEFSVRSSNITSWHQTKINAHSNTWTINALSSEGVLSAFKRRLTSSPSDLCVFVSQYIAHDLRGLSEKSSDPLDVTEFKSSLNVKESDCFSQLATTWSVPEEIAWKWLQRCSFECLPESQIVSINAILGDLYFENGRATAFPQLRDYLEKRFNHELTTELVRKEILNEGLLAFKDLSLDPTVAEKIQLATSSYLRTYSPFGFGGTPLKRRESALLTDVVLRPDGPSVTLVTGVAGSGKSGVIRGFLDELNARLIPHFALRIDQNLDCTNLVQVSQNHLQRNESPEVILKSVAKGKLAVLVVDQLDAVSEMSGRNSAVKNAVLEIVEQLSQLKTVRLVLVCRTFDLESDRRLKQLKSRSDVETVQVGLLDWVTDVVPLLVSKNIDHTTRSKHERALLTVPLNLMLFIECADPRPFSSASDLFARLLEYKERQLNDIAPLAWPLIEPLSSLARWMSDNQKMAAPESVLNPTQRDRLSHAGMLVHANKQLNFFHESFFDFCYAHSFSNTGKTLLTLLKEDEQHLFRRTQVRQILETLRQENRTRYLVELESVLSATEVRYHIKDAVGLWLGSLADASADECNLVLRLDQSNRPFIPFVRNALLGSAAWFDQLNKSGWIELTLESTEPTHLNAIFWWMSNLTGTRGAQIAVILSAWWKRDAVRSERLLEWFGFSRRNGSTPELLTLCEELIRSKPAQLFQGQGGTRASTVLGNWTEGDASGSGVILKALFDVWFDTHPGEHPFSRDELNTMDQHHLQEVAEKSPCEFLYGTTDCLLRALDLAEAAGGASNYLTGFTWRIREEHPVGANAFLGLVILALKKLAIKDPSQAMEFLLRMDPRKHVTLLHLHLETIASASGSLISKHLLHLLDCSSLFDAGWHGAEWKSFADAARTAFQHLEERDRLLVEEQILSRNSELQDSVEAAHLFKLEDAEARERTRRVVMSYLSESGRTQWLILLTIGEAQLTPAARTYLGLLNRKFRKVLPSLDNTSGLITYASPIKEERAERMSDAQWLHAMDKYAARIRRNWPYHGADAAEDLVPVLRQAATKNPARFIALLQPILVKTHKSYVHTILSAAAESINLENAVVATAVKMAHAYPEKPYGMIVSRIIGHNPTSAGMPEVLDTLIWYMTDGNDEASPIHFSNSETTLEDINGLLREGYKLFGSGVNTVRGHAAEDFATVLWKLPECRERAWGILEERARSEESLSIRLCLVHSLLPLHNENPRRAGNIFLQLLDPPKAVEDATEWLAPAAFQNGFQLLRHTLNAAPDIGWTIVRRLINSENTIFRGIGVWHWCVRSFYDPALTAEAESFISESVLNRRLAASIAADFSANEAQNEQARRWLLRSFDDDDKIVRRHAAQVFRGISPNDVHHHIDVAKAYMESRAYNDDTYAFFYLLKNATCDVYDLVVEASEKLVGRIKKLGPSGQAHNTDLHYLQDLLKRDYAVTESNLALRKRYLDLFDQMLEMELYGIRDILKEHDRH